jgi:hypothetical protein
MKKIIIEKVQGEIELDFIFEDVLAHKKSSKYGEEQQTVYSSKVISFAIDKRYLQNDFFIEDMSGFIASDDKYKYQISLINKEIQRETDDIEIVRKNILFIKFRDLNLAKKYFRLLLEFGENDTIDIYEKLPKEYKI